MQAPIMDGVRIKRGQGEVVRLPRGASLTDFAEKIDAMPADLVKVLIGLGEMVTATQSIDDDTLLRRRPGHPCVLVDKGERVEVLLGDRSLDVPARIRPALEEVRRRPELRPRDLPLDERSRLVLARRLVREGLLRVVPE